MKNLIFLLIYFICINKLDKKYHFYKINKVSLEKKINFVNYWNKFDLKINSFLYSFCYCIFKLKKYDKSKVIECLGNKYYKINTFYKNFKIILKEKLYSNIKLQLVKYCKYEYYYCILLKNDLKIINSLRLNFYFNIKHNKNKYLIYESTMNKYLFKRILMDINYEENKTNYCLKYLKWIRKNLFKNFKMILIELKNKINYDFNSKLNLIKIYKQNDIIKKIKKNNKPIQNKIIVKKFKNKINIFIMIIIVIFLI